MRRLTEMAMERGWLRSDEPLMTPRLGFPLAADLPDVVHDFNRPAREQVLADMLEGMAEPCANPSYFGAEPEEVVGHVERYGLPLRTVLGLESGLMRSDPYYDEPYLAHFYREHYRNLYRPRRFSESWFFAEQIRNGQRIFERVAHRLPRGGRVLDVGCGMGGMLIAFQFAGHCVHGCDYGEPFARRGIGLGLDIRIGGPEMMREEDPFDLIILSHVLEHTSSPIEFLGTIRSLLKPDGICYIEVPGLMNLEGCYEGNVLLYLQNAHRWHFTAATLSATLRRAGLEAGECDEKIGCVAQRATADPAAMPSDGPGVVAELERLERRFIIRTEPPVLAA